MGILLSSTAVHAYFSLDRKERHHRTFFVLMVLTIVILILEILSVILNSGFDIHFTIVHRVVDTLGFMLSPLVPVCALFYIYQRTDQYQKITKVEFFWLGMPLAVNTILSVGSYHFNWMFSITGENIYVRGPLFYILPLTSSFYYIMNMLTIYTNRKKLGKEEQLILSLLIFIPVVMSGIQLVYFIYLTIWSSVAIAVIMNYIYIIHSQAKLDPLTGLANRLAYNEYLVSLRRKRNIVLSIINIDLDNFKSINDLFGHHEGDDALKVFARHLKEVFQEKGVSIRWGGDEFIVLLNEDRTEEVKKYLKKLTERIDHYNESNSKLYRIDFSYGLTVFNKDFHNLEELIQHSDRLMYQNKQKK